MSEQAIIPNPESVFTREYWQPATPYPEDNEKNYSSKLSTAKEVSLLAGQAATAIFAGEPRQALPAGSTLTNSSAESWTQPGSVLLIDIESISTLNGRGQRKRATLDEESACSRDPVRDGYMQDRSDLMATPASLFRRNSEKKYKSDGQEVTTAIHYGKRLHNQELTMGYQRDIFLGVFSYDKKGNVYCAMRTVWSTDDKSQVQGMAVTFRESLGMRAPILSIGDTYVKDEKGPVLSRVKSAELCLQGSLTPVMAKQKKRRNLSMGKLAIVPAA